MFEWRYSNKIYGALLAEIEEKYRTLLLQEQSRASGAAAYEEEIQSDAFVQHLHEVHIDDALSSYGTDCSFFNL